MEVKCTGILRINDNSVIKFLLNEYTKIVNPEEQSLNSFVAFLRDKGIECCIPKFDNENEEI